MIAFGWVCLGFALGVAAVTVYAMCMAAGDADAHADASDLARKRAEKERAERRAARRDGWPS